MKYKDLKKDSVYIFNRKYRNTDKKSILGKVVYKSANFIHIKPIGFIEGYGDINDIREFNKSGFKSFYTIQKEVPYCGDTKEDYPEYFI